MRKVRGSEVTLAGAGPSSQAEKETTGELQTTLGIWNQGNITQGIQQLL